MAPTTEVAAAAPAMAAAKQGEGAASLPTETESTAPQQQQQQQQQQQRRKKKKTPFTIIDRETRAALRFAKEQGIISTPKDLCVSSDEEDDDTEIPHWSEEDAPADEAMGTYSWRLMCRAGFKCLAVIDATGEFLAEMLGITTPRYQYVLDELVRLQDEAVEEAEEEERQVQQAMEREREELDAMEHAGAEAGKAETALAEPEPAEALGESTAA